MSTGEAVVGPASVPAAPPSSPSAQTPDGSTAFAPHPILTRYYADDASKRSYLRRMFDSTAGDYDRIESVLSLGSGRWYRRRALREAGLSAGMCVLDIASGTGLVAREALALVRANVGDSTPVTASGSASPTKTGQTSHRGPRGDNSVAGALRTASVDRDSDVGGGEPLGLGKAIDPGMLPRGGVGQVFLLDPSPGMLSLARSALKLPAVLSVGESLPFPPASFDFLSMGYALRHLPDLEQAFAEFHRVLRPGGRLCLLEITKPASRAARAALVVYFRALLPLLGRAMRTGRATRELWTYYWDTIDACVPPSVVLSRLTAAGFQSPHARRDLGLFTAYTATR